MNRKDSPQSVIDSYRRKQQMAPYFMAGLAVLLVVVGIIILVVWFTGSGRSGAPMALFASATPTETSTATATPVTPTATATETATLTMTPTITETATPSGPFEYKIQDGDTCWDIAAKNKVGLDVLLALNGFGNDCPIKPGDKILIPLPGAELPTSTPVPLSASGTKIKYKVEYGDSLASIASKFGTTTDAIIKENKLEDANKINMGDELTITVYVITPTVTKAPTRTITPGGPTVTNTPAPAAATATPKP